MGRHNYSQYSNNKKNADVDTETVLEPAVTEAELNPIKPVEVIEPEVVETPVVAKEPVAPQPETAKGVVVDCVKLNVRANPSASAYVVCMLDVASEIEINISKSTDEWFNVCTAAGIEGYCMRKFVNASL